MESEPAPGGGGEVCAGVAGEVCPGGPRESGQDATGGGGLVDQKCGIGLVGVRAVASERVPGNSGRPGVWRRATVS
jgi:hypothetical protein